MSPSISCQIYISTEYTLFAWGKNLAFNSHQRDVTPSAHNRNGTFVKWNLEWNKPQTVGNFPFNVIITCFADNFTFPPSRFAIFGTNILHGFLLSLFGISCACRFVAHIMVCSSDMFNRRTSLAFAFFLCQSTFIFFFSNKDIQAPHQNGINKYYIKNIFSLFSQGARVRIWQRL